MVGVLVFAIGASIGSFINVVADRLPQGRSLVTPRSACDSCGTPLSNVELIPILSYLVLRGRCRHCSVGIPIRVLAVEVATAALFVGLYLQHGLSGEFVVLAAAMAFLLAIATIDFDHQLILNSMTFPAMVAALALAAFWPELGFDRTFYGLGSNWASFVNSLLSGIGAFLVFVGIAIVSRQGMGLGDVKLALVLGFLLGYPAILVSLWLGVVSGGVVAVTLLATGLRGRKDAIPFGVFLAGGAIAGLFLLGWITSRYQQHGIQGIFL